MDTEYKFKTKNYEEAKIIMNAFNMNQFIFELTHNAFRLWDERDDIDMKTLEKVIDKINELKDTYLNESI